MAVYSNIPGTKSEKYNIKMIWEDNKTNCAKCNKIPSNIELSNELL